MNANSGLAQKPIEQPTALPALVDAPIQHDPEKLSGLPTIGTKRVPADVLINYLASGQTIHDFLNDYDAVTEHEVLAVLGVIKQAILDGELVGVRLRDENPF
ncbi:MAG: DUF433 domain-containing protein [Acidobacteria bacterium]|nr:DUF433 domain-containing protein [Acidobacteriota bacterium]